VARELFRQTLPDGSLIVSLVSEIQDGDFAVIQTRNKLLEENQSRLLDGEWNWLSQEHGTGIVWLNKSERALGVTGDALSTSSSQKIIAITVADCMPLLLVEASGVIGLLHLGWRGIEQGFLEKAIEFIEAKSAEPIVAVLGPCINECCYEFGQNQMKNLVERYGNNIVGETLDGFPSLSLKECVREVLKNCEVNIEYDDKVCTNCDPRHWSFRGEGTDKRQVMIAWKEEV